MHDVMPYEYISMKNKYNKIPMNLHVMNKESYK